MGDINFKVKVVSAPPGAAVVIDGNLTGVTPYAGTLKKGAYTVELTLEGYEKASKPFDVKDRHEVQELFVPLIMKTGTTST